jgi:hypothetical protein
MALHINRPGEEPGPAVPSDRRLWISRDGARVVEDGDPAAAVLLAPPLTGIALEDMARFGLTVADDKIVLPEKKMVEEAPEDKMAPAPANKGRKRRAK